MLFRLIGLPCLNSPRLVPREKVRRRTRAGSAASVSTNARSASGSGCRAIPGPIRAKNVLSAISTCTRTSSALWRNPTGWMFPTRARCTPNCTAKCVRSLAITAGVISNPLHLQHHKGALRCATYYFIFYAIFISLRRHIYMNYIWFVYSFLLFLYFLYIHIFPFYDVYCVFVSLCA